MPVLAPVIQVGPIDTGPGVWVALLRSGGVEQQFVRPVYARSGQWDAKTGQGPGRRADLRRPNREIRHCHQGLLCL
jgi:hypothetical protein